MQPSERLYRLPLLEDRLRMRERPAGNPLMNHTWANLLFLHWRVDPERLQRTLPPGLYVDLHDDAAYVGIVPFFMNDIRPRRLPAWKPLSNFLETNVRTYVHDAAGTPGVWFYSLDCNSPLTVWGARTCFHLPYRHARMSAVMNSAGEIDYASQVRRGTAGCRLRYSLAGEPQPAEPGSLEFFLVERYVMFAADRQGGLFTGTVVHRPYPIVPCQVHAWSSNLLAEHDFAVDEATFDHALATPGVDVDVFSLRRLGA